MTFTQAADQILDMYNNKPMTAKEIWDLIDKHNLYKSEGKTPWASLTTIMLQRTHNSNIFDASKQALYSIVEKNPIKFIKIIKSNENLVEDNIIDESQYNSFVDDMKDFIMSEMEMTSSDIMDKFNELREASLVIKRCMDDTEFLCDILNKADKNFIRKYYRSDSSGPVIDLRKEVCKTILLDDINAEGLEQIISKHREGNEVKLKSWKNPYKILHPLVNNQYKELDRFMINFMNSISKKLDTKCNITNFNGAQNFGNEEYWTCFYNKELNSQSDGKQLFIAFKDGQIICAVYRYLDNKDFTERIVLNNIEEFYKFINEYIHLIKDDSISCNVLLRDEIKKVLNDNNNISLNIREIKNRLSEFTNLSEGIILNMVKESEDFEEHLPSRYRIKEHMPDKLKNYLLKNGFITMDMLSEILAKYNIKIESINES